MLWKSNGFITDSALAKLTPHLAAVNVDLKAADERRHRTLTDAPLAPVLATLSALRAAGVWLEVSTPLIDGFNFVAHLPDLLNPDDYEGDPAARRVRVCLRVTPQGLEIIGDAVRAAEIEALLQQLEPAEIERMLCG